MAKAKNKNTLLIEEDDNTLGNSVEGTSDKKDRTISDTIGYHLASVGNGVTRTMEGIDDYVSSLAGNAWGGIVGLFDAEKGEQIKQETAQNVAKQSYGYNNVEQSFPDAKVADVNIGGVTVANSKEIAEGVGGMLPAVVASWGAGAAIAGMTATSSGLGMVSTGIGGGAGLGMVATGASLADRLPKIASLGTMGVGAAGNSTEAALNDGATFDQAIEYGTLEGAKEIATEMMFDGVTSGLYGSGVLNPTKKVGLTGLARFALANGEEGLEEVASSAIEPFIEAATYKGPDALKKYKSSDFWKGTASDFFAGMFVALTFSGTAGYGMSQIGSNLTTKEADINSCLEAISDVTNEAASRAQDGKLLLSDAKNSAESVAKNYSKIEKILMKSPAEKRASMIEKFSLESAFDKTTGRMTEEFSTQIGQESNRINSLNNVAPEEIQAEIDEINANNHNAEIVDVNNLSDKAQLNFEKTAKALDVLNEKSKGGLQLIPVSADETFKAAQIGNRLYMNVDSFEDGSWADNFVHEHMHFAEGTAEYESLLETLDGDFSLIEDSIVDLADKGYSESDIQRELPATVMEKALNSEEFIDKIISKDSGLAEKIINKVKTLSESIKNINNAEYKRLKTIENKYLKAIESAGMQYIDNKILGVPDMARLSYKQNVKSGTVPAILANTLTFGDKYGYLSGKNASEVRKMMSESVFTNNNSSDKISAANDIANFIIDKALYGRMITEENAEAIEEASRVIEILDEYKHRIDLSDKAIKKSISKMADSQKIFANWGLRKGYEGISLVDALNEMQEKGIVFEQITTDAILDINNLYEENIKEAKAGFKNFKKNFDKAELNAIKENIVGEIMDAYQKAQAEDVQNTLDKQQAQFNKEISEAKNEERKVIDWFNKAIASIERRHTREIRENIRAAKKESSAKSSLSKSIRGLHDVNFEAFAKTGIHDSRMFIDSIKQIANAKFKGTTTSNLTMKAIAGLNEWYSDKEGSYFAEGEEGSLMYNKEIKDMLEELSYRTYPLTENEQAELKRLMKKFKTEDIGALANAYTQENLGNEFDLATKQFIDELNKESQLNADEMKMLKTVLAAMKHIATHNKMVIRDGEYKNAKPIVEDYIRIIHENQDLKKFNRDYLNKAKHLYNQTFIRPETVCKYYDDYKNGFLTQSFKEFQRAEVDARIQFMKLTKEIHQLVGTDYMRELRKTTIDYRGYKIPKNVLIRHYMTLNRGQAQLGLALNGFVYKDENGKFIRPDGFVEDKNTLLEEKKTKSGKTAKNRKGETLYKLNRELLNKACQDERNAIKENFTEKDLELIALAEKMFEECKTLKFDTDMLMNGWSNVHEDNYIPIQRYRTGQDIDTGFNFMQEMDHVSNASFNKNTVTGAQGEILYTDFYDMLMSHAMGVSMYANLAAPIFNYNLLRKINMNNRSNKPETIATEMVNVWENSDSYMNNLIEDIQGIGRNRRTKTGTIDWFDFVRGNWAVARLGLNPKVWGTQFSSALASTAIISDVDLAKGMKIGGKYSDVDKYCALAEFRNYDGQAAKAEAVLDTLNTIQKAETAPIGAFDRMVVVSVWGGCQANIARTKNLAIGTEENKVEAGKLLERVILETQQNSFATTRSDAMRSGKDALKVVTMFSADNMQLLGTVLDAQGELNVIKEQQAQAEKENKGSGKQYDAKLKQARLLLAKRLFALSKVNAYMAGIAMLFAKFKGQLDDKEKEELWKEAITDYLGNFLGGLPLIKEIYSGFATGYGFNSNPELSALSDVVETTKNLMNSIQNGNVTPWTYKKFVSSVLECFGGIAASNAYTYTTSFMRLLPNMDVKIESVMFNKTSFSSELKKAIENQDEDRIATIVDIMTSGRIGTVSDKKSMEELNRLTTSGYDVIPKNVSNKITVDGETIKLTKAEQKAFKATMNKANDAVAQLVKSTNYSNASDAVKAKAIKMVYDYYYQMAKDEATGTESTDKIQLLANVIPIEQLAIIMAECKSFEADVVRGKTVAGSKKKKVWQYLQKQKGLTAVQKYMIMGCLGYSNTNGKGAVIREINSLSLSEEQKEILLKSSGY